MKKILAPFLAVTATLLFESDAKHASINHQPVPNDYFWMQRAFPFQSVPSKAYYLAVDQTKQQLASRGNNALTWTPVGPNNISGRITDVAMHAADTQTIYAASASGGIWKSPDFGLNWAPVSDGLPSLSIGDIAIDPSDKNTIYCGTGETNGGGGSVTYDGKGIFKSTDGGITWIGLGLENTGSIGRIEVDPKNANRVWVAAMGSLFSNNSERGVYRSTDGGQTWSQNLFINDSTGIIDLAIHPDNPDTLFAVAWQRVRKPNKRAYGGPASGLYRSTNGGATWTRLTNGLPSGPNTGRMGICISPSNPNILFLTAANTNGAFAGIYKTANNGDSWSPIDQNGDPGYYSFGWWFGQIRVHPNNASEIFNLGVDWIHSADGGNNWQQVSDYLHADYHALYINPTNPNLRVVGNDGGVFVSSDDGLSWEHKPFPITQFYTCEIDFQYPHRFSGGAQDNGTLASFDNGPDQWTHIYGGDGFTTLVNPIDNSIFYATSQYGGFGGSNGASAPTAARYNWNAPYIFDPNDPSVMYFGAERLFKSTDGGLSWNAISDDLSNGNTGAGGVVYGTITTIAASPVDPNHLIAGTDDGNVWITQNGGASWNKVSSALPKRWVTRVACDWTDPHTYFVCFSGFRHHENIAHVYKTTTSGLSWTDVSGNLPDIPVNDIILDPADPTNWFIATDAGVFSTLNGGDTWESENTGLPLVPVVDLTFHGPTRTLLAATYGRSMYVASIPVSSHTNSPEWKPSLRVHPNPVSAFCTLSIHLPAAGKTQAVWYDVQGKPVKTIHFGDLSYGHHQVEAHISDLPAGVYYCRLNSSQAVKVVKL
ncbi:MAG: hypothetical protein JNJ57_07280 [Saprospiraceae bacterium]|nr:hypothetical protein [Saprospiraceae bacterium]